MPWQSTNAVNERLKFVAAHLGGLYTVSELCLRYGISRETGYTWMRRYREEGPAGLTDRSHAPKRCPHCIEPHVEELLLAARRSHPHWGPRKLVAWLAPRHPTLRLPAASSVGDLLKRRGLVQARRRKRGSVHPGRIQLVATEPNQVWAADFKGQFRMGDSSQCYPLTISDAHSRFLLGCKALESVRAGGVIAGFTDVFQAYGLPEAIRTDNGYPFATASPLGLTRLNVWWIKLGIRHDRIQPGRPQQNGAHERMHRTLKAETTRPPGRNLADQQMIFDVFRTEYDFERPHETLDQRPPAAVYVTSDRPMPGQLPEPVYPGHAEIRRVRSNGEIQFRGRGIFVSELLVRESVGLEEIDDGIWSVYFHRRLLGRLDERTLRVSG